MSEQLPPPPPPAPPGDQPLSPSDERTFAMLGHLGGILIGFLSGLIVMLVWGKRSDFVDDQAKEALNFQITLIIGWVVVTIITLVTFGLGAILYFVLWLVDLVFCIIAGLAANRGERYRYPFNIRLVK